MLPHTTTYVNFEEGMRKREEKHKKMRQNRGKSKDRPQFNIGDQVTLREKVGPNAKE